MLLQDGPLPAIRSRAATPVGQALSAGPVGMGNIVEYALGDVATAVQQPAESTTHGESVLRAA
ncbi:hypothetical protein GLX30_02920 [Streptomyces sp. Tu 2975]|uniref:hypothetical protein n=1 Tax=Streptomyces sp. Tu 2975 TaxID=2676871 RepID=UPI001357B0BE|nr:hypothetical protein [Streptomyces sp. Tu 2975]QIP83201.1 hypothetical protein GLX30_02920 [Streptomyces sp. Tu 2975]